MWGFCFTKKELGYTMRKMWIIFTTLLLAAALGLAACGNDSDNNEDAANLGSPTITPLPTPDGTPGDLFAPSGSDLTFGADLGGGSDLPGCADPDDEECPAALDMPLDGTAVADGLQISYPERYFTALTGEDIPTGAPPGTLIQIVPSENNRYDEEAVFSLYYGDAVASAVADLEDAETAAWSTDALTGTIAVTRDDTVDPPISRTIGAFATEDAAGGDATVVVLELTTTGKYGWDLWSRVYVTMLDSIIVVTE